MARATSFGKPDVFITIICNANWPEIQSSLQSGQTAADRPDIIARVFIQKIKRVLQLLVDQGILGKVIAHNGTIEFQKRGLPHVHLLLVFAEENKPSTVDDIDRLVSAQIPDPERNPKLYSTVTKFMMHGPCGDLNPKCPCMEDKADGNPGQKHCSKKYPRDFLDVTDMSKDGHPR